MELNEFQNAVNKLSVYPRDLGPYYTILGVQKEIGKLAEKLMVNLEAEKPKFDQNDIMRISITIGDVIHQLVCMAADLGITFSEIASLAIKKRTLEYDKYVEESMKTGKR